MNKILQAVVLFWTGIFCSAQMMSSIYFEKNSAKLRPAGIVTLDSIAILKIPLTFRIFGNCDLSGSEQSNEKLSEERALTVQKYLQNRGVAHINFGNAVGLGEAKQINDNSTELLKQKNRRVDIFMERTFRKGEKVKRKPYPDFLSLKITQMKPGDTLSLPDINFIGGRHFWLSKGNAQLLKITKILSNNPGLEIKLLGYICCEYEDFDGLDIDDQTYNLSLTRAQAVKSFLERKGIDPKRLKVQGLGHLNPVIYPEITEADRDANRRVEVVLLKK